MESMIMALQMVFPMCVYMALGFGLQRKKFFSEKGLKDMNNLVFKVLLPLSVVKSIVGADLRSGIQWEVLAFVAVTTLMQFFACWFVCPKLDNDKRRISVMIQGINKSNYVLLGTSLVAMAYGDKVGMAGVLVAVTAPLNNILAAITFEIYRGGKIEYGKLIKKILINPLVCSSLVGMAISLSGIPVPAYLMSNVVNKLAAIATPLALIAMGAGFSFEYAGRYAKQISFVTVARLILVPLFEVPLAIFCGFTGANMMAILICAATPTAVNSYSTAVSMGGDGELAGVIVAITSVLSVVTLFFWISFASMMGVL